MIEYVVKANLKHDYYFKLRHSLETSHLVKQIYFCYFSYIFVDLKNLFIDIASSGSLKTYIPWY